MILFQLRILWWSPWNVLTSVPTSLRIIVFLYFICKSKEFLCANSNSHLLYAIPFDRVFSVSTGSINTSNSENMPRVPFKPKISSTPVMKLAIPTICAYPQANDAVKSNLTLLWSNKLKEYAIANFITGVDEIFGLNGTLGIFSEFDVLMDPIETANPLSYRIN